MGGVAEHMDEEELGNVAMSMRIVVIVLERSADRRTLLGDTLALLGGRLACSNVSDELPEAGAHRQCRHLWCWADQYRETRGRRGPRRSEPPSTPGPTRRRQKGALPKGSQGRSKGERDWALIRGGETENTVVELTSPQVGSDDALRHDPLSLRSPKSGSLGTINVLPETKRNGGTFFFGPLPITIYRCALWHEGPRRWG
jgi:hypothetical protein